MSDTMIRTTEDRVFYRKYKGNFQVEYFRYNNAAACGIYTITNLDNGKIYIGQCECYRDRTAEHRRDFKKLKHFNKHLKRAYDKGQNLLMQFIENCTVEQLDEREIFWIAFLKTKGANGYNQTDGGKTLRGMRHTEEWKEKRSTEMKEYRKINKVDNSDRYIPVLCYSLQTGDFLSEYPSIAGAANATGIPIPTISGNLTGKRGAAKQYIFRYKTADIYPLSIEISDSIRYDKNRGGLAQYVLQTDMNDNPIKIWMDKVEFCTHIGLSYSAVAQRLYRANGKSVIIGSYKYKRI